MNTTALVIMNLVLSGLTIAAVVVLVRLAHRLPEAAPREDADWGRGKNPWVPSDPLPLVQVATHEDRRGLARAA